MYLHPELKPYFRGIYSLFDQMMALRGECFRHQEGRLTQRIRIGNKTYFIKQHNGVGWKEIIKNLLQFRLPVISAKNEWRAIQKLQSLGVKVPNLLAYGERGRNPARRESFILMEELQPTISIEELSRDWQQTPPAFAYQSRLIKRIASIAKTLHENGINHRDFYICHFLLNTKLDELYLIDLHRAEIRRLTKRRWIIKDLAGLYFSSKGCGLTQRDYYRFMKVYAGKTLREILQQDTNFWKKVKARGERLYSDHI